MRLRIAAWGIVIVATLDVFIVLAAHYLGWIDWPTWDSAPVASVVLPASIVLLFVSMIGALSLIVSRGGGAAFSFETCCYECGSEKVHDLSFCARCGATA